MSVSCKARPAAERPVGNGTFGPFHQSLRREFLADRTFPSLQAAQDALDAWVADYNTTRPHQALEMATPAERFRLECTSTRRLRMRVIPGHTQVKGPSLATK